MSDQKHYVTAEEGKSLSFNYDYKQVFDHQMKVSIAEFVVVKEFAAMQNEMEKKALLEILVFLRDFYFATEDQISRMLQYKGLQVSDLGQMLRNQVRSRILNMFTLAQYDMKEIPDDAFKVYCLDHGGISVLSHFSTTDCISWLSTDCVRSAELIAKYLTTNLFYLELANVRGEDLAFFKPIHTVTIGKRDTRFSAEFQIMQGYTPHTFILESVRRWDLPVQFAKKVNEHFSAFILQNFWRRYYSIMPLFIFLVENEEDGLEVAETFYRRIQSDQFRIITDDTVKKGFDSVIMYKYVPGAEESEKGKLVPVRSGMFSRSAK